MPSSLRTFRLGRGDEDTLVTTFCLLRGAHPLVPVASRTESRINLSLPDSMNSLVHE